MPVHHPLRALLAGLVLSSIACITEAATRDCSFRVEPAQRYAFGLIEGGLQQPLLLDAYLPTTCNDGPAGTVPPVIVIAGGGFNVVDRDRPRIVEVSEGLARAGFAVFSIEHRVRYWKGRRPVSETMDEAEMKLFMQRVARSPYPQEQHFQGLIATEDAYKAEAWITARAAQYDLDMAHLGLLGGSSGSFTVLGMEYSGQELGFAGSSAKAVVDMWGDFFPHTDMKAGEAPVLILAGTLDPVVDYALTTNTMYRAGRVGVEAARITMPGVEHGMDSADIFHRRLAGTDMTLFEVIVQFMEAKLRPGARVAWPPTGQGREMLAEETVGP